MATIATLEPTAEDAQYQALTQHYLDEIAQVNRTMERDQQEIERLRVETRTLLADMQVVLKKIEAR